MIASTCKHERKTGKGKDRKGQQRWKCLDCGVSWTDRRHNPLGTMQIGVETAKLALRLLLEGNSIRSTERLTKLHRDTICRLIVFSGERCRTFMDNQMRDLELTHLQFDEQHTTVYKKQARLTVDEKAERHDIGKLYIWTCIDQRTKLMSNFIIGKRSADNARRFLMDVASRLRMPGPGQADDHAFTKGRFRPVVQISTDGFAAYPEAVDLAFGPYARYGSIIKEYRNANMVYTPSEMVGTKRTGHRGGTTPWHRGSPVVHDMYIARRTGKRNPAAIPEASEPPNVLLQQEAGKLGSRLCNVRRSLQFHLADSEAWKIWPEATNGGYDGESHGPHLDVR